MQTNSIAVLLAASIFCVGGCGNKEDGFVRPVSNKTASELNSEHSRFETTEDPPFTADTRFAAGQLAESQNAPARAAAQYEEALKLNPKHPGATYRLGIVYTQMREDEKAIAAWQRYVELTGGSATAYGNLGFCYELVGKREEAELAYRQGIERDPQNQACRINYGLMLTRAGRASEAIQQLQVALSPAESHYNMASVYEQQGNKEEARKEYAKALQLDPAMWEAQARMQKLK